MGISTDLQVKRATKPGRHKVDNGDGYKWLFLVVQGSDQDLDTQSGHLLFHSMYLDVYKYTGYRIN